MTTEPPAPGWWLASDGNHYPPEQHPDPAHRARYATPPAPAAPPAPPAPAAPPTPSAPPPAAAPPSPTAPAQPPSAADTRATVAFGSSNTFSSPPQPGTPPGTPIGDAPLASAPWDQLPGSPAAIAPTGTQSAVLTVEPAPRIARWRAIAHVFMVIPHSIVNSLLSFVGQFVTLVAWFVILITGKLPRGLHDFSVMVLRYGNRMIGYTLWMTEEYPPFEFTASADDPTRYPVRTDVPYVESHSRVTTLFRFVLVIPHVIVLIPVMIAAYLVGFLTFFAVLFTGAVPDGLGRFLIGTGRWVTRVNAYARLLTDAYPPFSLS